MKKLRKTRVYENIDRSIQEQAWVKIFTATAL